MRALAFTVELPKHACKPASTPQRTSDNGQPVRVIRLTILCRAKSRPVPILIHRGDQLLVVIPGHGGPPSLSFPASKQSSYEPRHRQLGGWLACGMRLSRVGGRDDDTCLPELRRLPLSG